MFGMMVDTGPKFYVVPSPSQCMTLWLCKSFVLKCLAFDGFDSCLAW